jgi:hypothetical protein
MSHQRDQDAYRVIRKDRLIHHENSDRNRYSKVFRHTCRVCAIYLMLCAIALFILFIASVFDCFPAIATLAMFLAPHILRLGCLLSVGFIFVVVYEGLR